MSLSHKPDAPAAPAAVAPEQVTIPVVQEHVEVSRRETETGAVQVRKVVHEETQRVPLGSRSERVNVVRVPADRQVDAEYPVRQEGDTTIIPVFEYRPVVELRLFLVEEVHITKEVKETVRTEEVTTRREEVVIERRVEDSGHGLERPPDPDE